MSEMRDPRWWMVLVVLVGCSTPSTPPAPVHGPFDPLTAFEGWAPFALPGKRSTRYTPQWLEGQPVVHADADESASLYRRALRVPSTELNKVRFSWRVPALIPMADLRDRDAADSPVRVVLAFDGDLSRLLAKERLMFELAHAVIGEAPPYASLMYVWDNEAPVESVISGGRSARVRKIVVDSGTSQAGVWRFHERSIVNDFRRAFGEEPGALIGVALMTDTDNTRTRTQAWYGAVQVVGLDGRIR
jgi:hypothetical protein